MQSWVVLLRAVNVGGVRKLPMADLRAMAEAEGFAAVRTFIASGNLLLHSALAEDEIKRRIEARLHAYAGRPVGVLARTAAEMAGVAAANPFPDAPGNRTVAVFLDEAPAADALSTVRNQTVERLAAGRREIYVAYGPDMGRSRLLVPAAKRGTARNLNTVAKLAELAAE